MGMHQHWASAVYPILEARRPAHLAVVAVREPHTALRVADWAAVHQDCRISMRLDRDVTDALIDEVTRRAGDARMVIRATSSTIDVPAEDADVVLLDVGGDFVAASRALGQALASRADVVLLHGVRPAVNGSASGARAAFEAATAGPGGWQATEVRGLGGLGVLVRASGPAAGPVLDAVRGPEALRRQLVAVEAERLRAARAGSGRQLERVHAELALLQAEVAELTAARVEAVQRAEVAESEGRRIRGLFEDKAGKLKAAAEQLQQLKHAHANLQREVRRLQEHASTGGAAEGSEVQALQQRVAELEQEVAAAIRQQTALREAAENFASQHRTLAREFDQVVAQRDKANEGREALRGLAGDLQRELAALRQGGAAATPAARIARAELAPPSEAQRELRAALEREERVRDYLRRTQSSRTWRVGTRAGRVFRTLTFRKPVGRSALDYAIELLEGDPANGRPALPSPDAGKKNGAGPAAGSANGVADHAAPHPEDSRTRA